jgi:hypothetical protein
MSNEEVTGLIRTSLGEKRNGLDFDHLDFRVGFDYDRFPLADAPVGDNAPMVKDQSFTGLTGLIAYSAEFGSVDPNGSPRMLGIAVGYNRTNNKGELKAVEDTDGALPRKDYREKDAILLNTDYVIFPRTLNNRVAVNFFTRTNFASGDTDFRPGVGLFLTEKGDPYKSVGGISFSKGDDDKLRVDLITGFNF